MTSSTTLKLPEKLKARVADAAKTAAKTPHAFMVDAIEQYTSLSERRSAFLATALTAREEVAAYGLVHDGDEVLSYFEERLKGGKPARPHKRAL